MAKSNLRYFRGHQPDEKGNGGIGYRQISLEPTDTSFKSIVNAATVLSAGFAKAGNAVEVTALRDVILLAIEREQYKSAAVKAGIKAEVAPIEGETVAGM